MDLKTIIRDGQARAAALTVIERDIPFDPSVLTGLQKAITITGPRRAGKTSFMVQMMKQLALPNETIVFLDFSDIALAEFSVADFPALLSAQFELNPVAKPWFFLDEIQEIAAFERGIKHLLNNGAGVVITGSSAKLFSGEIASTLRGKTLPLTVMPLNFREYCRFRGHHLPERPSTRERAQTIGEFHEFLHWGGFPEVVLSSHPETRRSLIKSYVDIMLYRDIVDRNAIKSSHLAELLFAKILYSLTREISVTKWHNDFKSAGHKFGRETLFQYLAFFEDAQYVTLLQNRAGGVTSRKKACLVDNGLFAPLRSLSPDLGKLFENQIFRDLSRRNQPLHFFKHQDGEADFVRGEAAIQACYRVTDDNVGRECAGAAAALRFPGIRNARIVYLYDERSVRKAEPLPENCRLVHYLDFIDE